MTVPVGLSFTFLGTADLKADFLRAVGLCCILGVDKLEGLELNLLLHLQDLLAVLHYGHGSLIPFVIHLTGPDFTYLAAPVIPLASLAQCRLQCVEVLLELYSGWVESEAADLAADGPVFVQFHFRGRLPKEGADRLRRLFGFSRGLGSCALLDSAWLALFIPASVSSSIVRSPGLVFLTALELVNILAFVI
jgi:hypothetical protein